MLSLTLFHVNNAEKESEGPGNLSSASQQPQSYQQTNQTSKRHSIYYHMLQPLVFSFAMLCNAL